MGTFDFILHLLNFFAPALGVAMLLTAASRLLIRRSSRSVAFWHQCAFNFVAGSIALAVALVLFGRDGKMLAYAALILATASSEWWQAGGWQK
jgi:hypothetical protein